MRGIDFERLYHEFGLARDADFDALRLAYRRRVAKLHPDRIDTADPISQDLANQHLQRLTALYEAAARFHREHGRLPGAAAAARGGAPPPAPAPACTTSGADAPASTGSGRSRASIALACMLVVVLAVWLVHALETTDHAALPSLRSPPAAIAAPSVERAPGATAGEGIHRGMPETEVVRILGEPITRTGARWDYGPSWVQFEDGVVVTWYSSPLRSLRIARNPHAAAAPADGASR